MSDNKIKKNSYTIEDLEEIKSKMQVLDMYVESVDTNYNLIGYIANNIRAIMPREEFSSIVNDEGLVDANHIVNKSGKVLHVCIKDIIKNNDDTIEVITSKKILEVKVRKWMYMHLKPGVKLKGVVINLAERGAFVDVGVKHDGLVHISEMSEKFVKNPSEIVSVGDVVKVKVIKIDQERQKVGLSMKI